MFSFEENPDRYCLQNPTFSAANNSEIRRVVDDVLDAVKYTICVVAANPGQHYARGTIEGSIAQAVGQLPDHKKRNYQVIAQRFLELNSDIRGSLFGRHGAVEPRLIFSEGFGALLEATEPVPVDRELLGFSDRAVTRGPVNIEKLEQVWGPFIPSQPGTYLVPPPNGGLPPAGGDPNPLEALHYNRVEFRIRWIHCVDETGSGLEEKTGSDEISVAGVAVDTLGNTFQIGKKTYTEFDDNNKEYFDPNWKFTSLNIPKPDWNKEIWDAYTVMIALAEIDNGGMNEFLTELYAKVDEIVLAQFSAVVFGGTAPYLGPALAAVVAAAAARGLDELVKWIIKTFKDDIFNPQTAALTINRNVFLGGTLSYYDGEWGVNLPQKDMHFYGHNGHYAIRYYWRLLK